MVLFAGKGGNGATITSFHLISLITHLTRIPPPAVLTHYLQHHTFCFPFILFADALVTFKFSAEQELAIREQISRKVLSKTAHEYRAS